jgi:hypothetical protein
MANYNDKDFFSNTTDATKSRSHHAELRTQLESDIESFLSSGGQVQEIEPNVMADPPKKPESKYGSRPI